MQGSTRIDELRQKFHENPRRYFAPLANEYRKAGDPEQAIAICRAHLAQQPGHMSGHVVYGQALYDARRTDEARGVFEKALALDPDNAIVLRHLGDIAREKGDSNEARHWYTRALDVDPSDREVAAYIAELTEPVTAEGATEPVAAPAAATEVSAEPVVESPKEVEVPIEPAVAADSTPLVAMEVSPDAGEAAPAEEEVAWRKTPPAEDSPFVTRTMAELYANQGYREAALDVYRQLALHHPDDKEIFDRIEALEKDTTQIPPQEEPPEEPRVEQLADTVEHSLLGDVKYPEMPLIDAPDLDQKRMMMIEEALSGEIMISDLPSEPEEEKIPDVITGDDTDEYVYMPSDEDMNMTTVAPPQPAGSHFTEKELGDSWDTDSWAAGFSSEDAEPLVFDAPDVAAKPVETATEEEAPAQEQPVSEPEPVAEAEALPEAEPAAEAESAAEPEPAAAPAEEPEPAVAQAPEPVELADADPTPPVAEPESEPAEEPQFVAYSPQPPAGEDLPHFAPKGPTVREFFAAIGAYRPPARDGSSITAHAAIPSGEATPAEAMEAVATEYPLATDAFSNLFSGDQVSEEDTRAAFALSGALGAHVPEPQVTRTPAQSQPAATEPTAQESEEDIRRFREWLDGLAES